MAGPDDPVQALLKGPIAVINIGLEGFATVLRRHDVPVLQIDWAPPAGGDPRLMEILEKLGA